MSYAEWQKILEKKSIFSATCVGCCPKIVKIWIFNDLLKLSKWIRICLPLCHWVINCLSQSNFPTVQLPHETLARQKCSDCFFLELKIIPDCLHADFTAGDVTPLSHDPHSSFRHFSWINAEVLYKIKRVLFSSALYEHLFIVNKNVSD